ncbi:MAG: hypothetical protein ACYCXN_14315, partial [Acidimicrobiales bacterium]
MEGYLPPGRGAVPKNQVLSPSRPGRHAKDSRHPDIKFRDIKFRDIKFWDIKFRAATAGASPVRSQSGAVAAGRSA